MNRVAYDMSVLDGQCQFHTVMPTGGHGPMWTVGLMCWTPTRGLVVYVPVDEAHMLRVNVCPEHLRALWKIFGEPRGEAEWQFNPAVHSS